ncbi:cytochrome b/b6 domain-containing protein [Marinobacter sp.]|uniref:cytochrome b/b6 domain-containing protein n=1 Tax=Marinobacter sp. TaxID=50741 RepID=UPI003567C0D0
MSRVLMFKRFERFWHWSQALLIFTLLFSGFVIHGTFDGLRFDTAVKVHTLAAWALIVLWLFAIFWHITTGEWRQYIPTRDGLFAVMHYYLIGTFTGASHPYKKTSKAKHNPLQRLAYLFFKLVITPIIWVSGLLYLFYNDWPETLAAALELETVAMVHTGAAFGMLVFVIAHVYMTTMGKTLTSHIKPMVTGYEDLEDNQ